MWRNFIWISRLTLDPIAIEWLLGTVGLYTFIWDDAANEITENSIIKWSQKTIVVRKKREIYWEVYESSVRIKSMATTDCSAKSSAMALQQMSLRKKNIHEKQEEEEEVESASKWSHHKKSQQVCLKKFNSEISFLILFGGIIVTFWLVICFMRRAQPFRNRLFKDRMLLGPIYL